MTKRKDIPDPLPKPPTDPVRMITPDGHGWAMIPGPAVERKKEPGWTLPEEEVAPGGAQDKDSPNPDPDTKPAASRPAARGTGNKRKRRS